MISLSLCTAQIRSQGNRLGAEYTQVVALFTELPRAGVLGNLASGTRHSRKPSFRKKPSRKLKGFEGAGSALVVTRSWWLSHEHAIVPCLAGSPDGTACSVPYFTLVAKSVYCGSKIDGVCTEFPTWHTSRTDRIAGQRGETLPTWVADEEGDEHWMLETEPGGWQ